MTGRLLAERCKRCDRRLYEVRNYGVRATYCALCDLGLPTLRDRHPVTQEPVPEPYKPPRFWVEDIVPTLPIIIVILMVVAEALWGPK